MFYFTGDFHGEYSRYDYIVTATGAELTENDYLFVCGDWGFVFYPEGTMSYYEQQHYLNEISKLPYITLAVDGNHENFDKLNDYPIEIWKGGKVHKIRENIIHLMRGQVYDIEGTKIFTMGGAYSIDKYMRKEGYSWWPQEMPNDKEYKEAIKNLEAANMKVDIILSHTAPTEITYMMGYRPDLHEAALQNFLQWILETVDFKLWCFGHFHTDSYITDKIRAVYFDVVSYPSSGE